MAISHYYVDPLDGEDAPGGGAIGNPWRTTQYALDNIARNAEEGDQVNIRSTAADVLAASLDLATYGTPSLAAPLIFRGYTAAADDGGMGIWDGNAGNFHVFANTNYQYLVLIDMEVLNFGTGYLYVGPYNAFLGCYIHTTSIFGIRASNHCLTFRCCIEAPVPIHCNDGISLANYVRVINGPERRGITINNGTRSVIQGNIIDVVSSQSAWGIQEVIQHGATISNNIIVNRGAGLGEAIGTNPAYAQQNETVINNIITGWSGAGAVGVNLARNAHKARIGHNAFYNNTTNYVLAGNLWIDERANDILLEADPFVNAADGDFALTDAAKALLRSAGWPDSYLGAATDPHITIGAVQYGEAEGTAAGGAVKIASMLGRGMM